MSTERVAYVNGEILPESQATVSINDRGFLYGDAVFDTTRTFNGEIFTDVLGGIEPYAYSWTGPNNFTSTDQNLSFLFAGSYFNHMFNMLTCSSNIS